MKKILYLGVKKKKIINLLIKKKYNFDYFESIDENEINFEKYRFIICYRYKRIFSKNLVNKFKKKIINCHQSYLPWNRGSNPNFWSFFYDTPKGVTIHFVDNKIDTGEIIAQKMVKFKITKNSSLKSTYQILDKNLENLIVENLENIINGDVKSFKQENIGTYYNMFDFKPYKKLLKNGWNTKINLIKNKGYEFF